MHMRAAITLTIMLGLSLSGASAQDAAKKAEAAKKEMEALEGTWVAVAATRDGEQAPEDRLQTIKLVFKANQVTHRQTGKYELDPAEKPKSIDIKPLEDTDAEKIIKGIYEIKGDELTVCVSMPGKERPTEFASKPGSGTALLVLKKAKSGN